MQSSAHHVNMLTELMYFHGNKLPCAEVVRASLTAQSGTEACAAMMLQSSDSSRVRSSQLSACAVAFADTTEVQGEWA
jgi:hypothetical protein